jgi:alkaline phosphatase D
MGSRGDIWVDWEIATDSGFTKIVQSSRSNPTAYPRAIAERKFAHSVHLEVTGLESGRNYWYRFKAGPNISPVGRTKTAPASGARLDRMVFAFVSCQSWQAGLYPAYYAMANEPGVDGNGLDLVVHLGDYIYEYAPAGGGPRKNRTAAPTDLAGYRNRHAEYKTDQNLQKAHAACPWLVTWDDHEVYNAYAGGYSGDQNARRDAAYQAYYEHMPIRPSSVLGGAQWRNINLYGRLDYGNLAQFNMLDTRQYRHDQVYCSGVEYELVDQRDSCYNDRFTDTRTMTGDPQQNWLLSDQGLGSTLPSWHVMANAVPMAEYDNDWPDPSYESYYVEAWDGYSAARDRILNYVYQQQELRPVDSPLNPIVITGDMHSSWVADLKLDFNKDVSASNPIVGTEFTGTSISSVLSSGWNTTYQNARSSNPHVKYYDGRPGGYVRCDLNANNWHSDFFVANSLRQSQSPMTKIASWVVESGSPNGAVRG